MRNTLMTMIFTFVLSFASTQTVININNQDTEGQTTILYGFGQPTLNFIEAVQEQTPQYDLFIQDRNSNSVMSGWYLTVPPEYTLPVNSNIQSEQGSQIHNYYWIRNN